MRPLWTLLVTAVVLTLSPAGAAQSQARRPVVFVPGILGSKLVLNGEVLWGADVLASFRHFNRLEFDPSSPDLSIASRKPDCLLEQAHVLSTYLAASVYRGIVEFFHSNGYRDGEDLFVFCYDWRRSVFDIAADLDKFVGTEPRLSGRKFDLVMHSMGGLVGRTFLQTYPETASQVSTFAELAVPHRGSISILSTLYEGWGSASRIAAGGIETIRKVVFSFDSFFELLPWYTNCCGLGVSPPSTPRLDFRNAALWSTDLRWLLPGDMSSQQIEARATRGAARLANLALLMERPLPPHVRHVVFSGRWQETYES